MLFVNSRHLAQHLSHQLGHLHPISTYSASCLHYQLLVNEPLRQRALSSIQVGGLDLIPGSHWSGGCRYLEGYAADVDHLTSERNIIVRRSYITIGVEEPLRKDH